MQAIIDTNIAVHLRDGDEAITTKVAGLPSHPKLSVLSRVELEGGVYRDKAQAALLRSRLDLILSQFDELPFGSLEAEAYGRIVQQCGYSRGQIVDRMIAATAITSDAVLITINGADFRNIPGLKLEVWPTP